MKNIFSISIFVLLVSVANFLKAQFSTDSLNGQSKSPNTVNTAVPFLRITPDARSGAMGDVGIALSPDANSIYWNASKLAFSPSDVGLSITYTPWLRALVKDIYLAHISGYNKIDKNQAIAGSLRYFSLGNIQFTNYLGQDQGQFKPFEMALDVAYARQLSRTLSGGITLKYVYSNLAKGQNTANGVAKAGTAAAADISFFYRSMSHIMSKKTQTNFGLVLSNIGSKVSYSEDKRKDFIPINLGIGGATIIEIDDHNSFTFAIDINKLLVPTPDTIDANADGTSDYREKSVVSGILGSFGDAPRGMSEEFEELMYSVGAEYLYNKQFAFRLGYYNEHKLKGNRKFFTLGIGLKYNIFSINLSFLVPTVAGQRNPLDNTLRFSMLFDFDDLK